MSEGDNEHRELLFYGRVAERNPQSALLQLLRHADSRQHRIAVVASLRSALAARTAGRDDDSLLRKVLEEFSPAGGVQSTVYFSYEREHERRGQTAMRGRERNEEPVPIHTLLPGIPRTKQVAVVGATKCLAKLFL